MTVKPLNAIFLGALLCAASAAWAQSAYEEVEWKESEAPPPPAFDVGKLVTIEVSPNSALVYGVDPTSISISKSDGLVRYVMVASSTSGARNVMYEAIHCATGEFKTYGRYSSDGRWTMVDQPQWNPFQGMPSRYALRFAQAGACDGAAAPSSVQVLVSRLKSPYR
jgi:hypothetical protein